MQQWLELDEIQGSIGGLPPNQRPGCAIFSNARRRLLRPCGMVEEKRYRQGVEGGTFAACLGEKALEPGAWVEILLGFFHFGR